MRQTDYINPELANTLPGLFQLRVQKSPESLAYGYFDDEKKDWLKLNWQQVAKRVGNIRSALKKENLNKGERIAIMLRNCPEWFMFDIAAIGIGLVTVPLYTNDRPDNVAYIVNDAGVKLLLLQNQRQWKQLAEIDTIKNTLQKVICTDALETASAQDSKIVNLQT